MMQVGCGSVGLMRNPSSAATFAPTRTNNTAGRLRCRFLIFISLLSGEACTVNGRAAKPLALYRTALALRKAESTGFWPQALRRPAPATGRTAAKIQPAAVNGGDNSGKAQHFHTRGRK